MKDTQESATPQLMGSEEQIGAALGVSKFTIRRARQAGELKAYRIGNNLVRIRYSDAQEWAERSPWEPRLAG